MQKTLAGFVCGALFCVIAALPVQARGAVSNLTVNKCSSQNKTELVNAAKVAETLSLLSLMAVNRIYEIKSGKAANAAFTEPRTGFRYDMPKIIRKYEKIFGSYQQRRWDVVRRKFASLFPLPLPILVTCVTNAHPNCARFFAFVEKKPTRPYAATIRICPDFLGYTLAAARRQKLYENASTVALVRGGMMLHELMHTSLMNTAATHDEDYDVDGVLALTPDEAEANADSYHVFTIFALADTIFTR